MRIDDAAFLHFEPEIVAFAGALAHAGEDRDAAVLHGDVVDQLHDDDGLAHARAAEQADLAAAEVGLQQVDDLDAGLEHFKTRRLLFEARRLAVDRVVLLGVDRAHLVHGLADDVEHAAERLRPHRHFHRMAEALRLHAAHQAFGGLQRDGAHAAFADVLLRFANDIDRLRARRSPRWSRGSRCKPGESALREIRSPRPVRKLGPLSPLRLRLLVAIRFLFLASQGRWQDPALR